jgi:hypothetical protein
MKLLLAMADAERFENVKRDVLELGASGYSVMSVLEGAGRSGLHAGDRAHPGSLVALWVVAQDAEAGTLFDALAQRRDAAADRVTRFFLPWSGRLDRGSTCAR